MTGIGIVASSPLTCRSRRGVAATIGPLRCASRGGRNDAPVSTASSSSTGNSTAFLVSFLASLFVVLVIGAGERSGEMRIPFPNVSREFSRRRARRSGEKRRARESKRTFRTCRTLWWVRSAVSRFPWRRSGRVWRGRGLTVHVDRSAAGKRSRGAGPRRQPGPERQGGGAGEENVRRTASEGILTDPPVLASRK